MKTHLCICDMPLFAVQFRCFWKHFISWTEISDYRDDLGRSGRGHLYPCLVQWIIKGPGKQGRRNCCRNHKPFFNVLYLLYQKLEEKLLNPIPWRGQVSSFWQLAIGQSRGEKWILCKHKSAQQNQGIRGYAELRIIEKMFKNASGETFVVSIYWMVGVCRSPFAHYFSWWKENKGRKTTLKWIYKPVSVLVFLLLYF